MQRFAAQTNLITPTLHRIWQSALDAPCEDIPRWIHGDMHPGNLLVEHGAISGIIDWGDMAVGEIATDLAAIWMLFAEQETRRVALTEYGEISPATLQRTLGWAILFGLMLLETGMTDTPLFVRIGKETLRRVCEDGADGACPYVAVPLRGGKSITFSSQLFCPLLTTIDKSLCALGVVERQNVRHRQEVDHVS